MQKMQWALLCVLSTTMACAESAKDVVAAFQNSLGTRQLVLRNFSGEEKVRASWTGTVLELDPPLWRTMGVVVVDSVKLKGHTLMVRGLRQVAVRDESDKVVLYQRPSEMEIEVDLGDSDPVAVLPQLKDALFYPSIEEALGSLPKTVRKSIPARMAKSLPDPTGSSKALNPTCDCAATDRTVCGPFDARSAGIIPPKYLSGRDPGYSNQARKAMLKGSMTVRFTVDDQGHPMDVWVARPLGLGLDERAARSVLTYVFKPAMCHDKPVTVELFSEAKFEIH
jgi:TonB-like protein